MHYVKRGAAPKKLAAVQQKYTPRWVAHYRKGQGNRPSDARWQDFHEEMRETFSSLCGYCETICKGEIDHFRPKREFPKRVYQWSNWVFACHDCNHSKSSHWPKGGYVDPCARIRANRPEDYFNFDITSGEIIPAKGLSGARWDRAKGMIDDLKLNAYHHLKNRLTWLRLVSVAMQAGLPDTARRASLRDSQYSSITRVLLDQEHPGVLEDKWL